MTILHLSDLHFSDTDNPINWFDQLADDLTYELRSKKINLLVLSGDIANYSIPAEYSVAEQFIKKLSKEFSIDTDKIIIVPGNHDVNWPLSRDAYAPVRRTEYKGKLTEDYIIDDKEKYIEVLDETKYKERFLHFCDFYNRIKGESYSLEYSEQTSCNHFPEFNLVVLGFNSAWQLDHHYTSRASINPGAVAKALNYIRSGDFADCLKLAVWHHPVSSPFPDRITDHGFLQRLSVAGVRVGMHGHIHKAESSLYSYDKSFNGRKMDIVCAGTFGAPIHQWTPGYPLQYNFIQVERKKIIVNTRKRVEPNGTWQPDAIWTQGAGNDPLPRYEILLEELPLRVSNNTGDEKAFNNLPASLTPLIGREKEIKDIGSILTAAEKRIVVMTGSGGSGKTRLAIDVAKNVTNSFKHGVCFVQLQAINDYSLVIPTIAKTLHIKETVDTTIHDYLREREFLLILDNFEHVDDATKDVTELLKSCPKVKVLITTRIEAPIDGGHSYPVPSLSYPPHYPPNPPIERYRQIEILSQYDAVNLFTERAGMINGTFNLKDHAPAVAEICHKLSGIALAIELAAGQILRYTPEQMLKLRLLKLLNGGAKGFPEKHKTMSRAIDWSYDLLNPEEQKLFRRLSVFRGIFSVEAVKDICNIDDTIPDDVEDFLYSLFQKNLIKRPNIDDNQRYILLDMIREYGEEVLVKVEEVHFTDKLMQKHADWYINFAKEAEDEITSSRRNNPLERLEEAYDNINIIFDRCQRGVIHADTGIKLAGNLFWFWNLQSNFVEGLSRVEGALEVVGSSEEPDLSNQAKALYCAGGLRFLQGDMEKASAYLNESINILLSLEDKSKGGYKRYRGLALIILSQVNVDIALSDRNANANLMDDALNQIESSVTIFQELGDKWGLALALNDLGNVFRSREEYDKALEEYKKSLGLWQEMNDSWGQPLTLSNMGFVNSLKGDYAGSRVRLTSALEIQNGVKDKWGLAETLKCLGDLDIHLQDYYEAKKHYCESLKVNLATGRKQLLVACIKGMALTTEALQEFDNAAIIFGAAVALVKKFGEFGNLTDKKLSEIFISKSNSLEKEFRDPVKFKNLTSKGAVMSIEQATQYTLTTCGMR